MENTLPDRLRELLYQLTKVPGQIEQEVVALLAVQTPPAPPVASIPMPPSAPSPNVAKAEEDLTQLWQQIEQAKAELERLTAANDEQAADLEKWSNDIAKASEQHYRLTAEATAAELQIHRLKEEQSQILAYRAQYEAVIEKAGIVQRELDAREQNVSANEAALTQREQIVNERAARLDGTRYWLESLLPTWLREDSIAPWRDAMMEDAQHPSASSTAAGLLFATLSLYTYAQRDTDARAVADALRDVGRRLFAWLKERNLGDYDASVVAQAMAEQINRECSGRCELEVPVPGSAAQNQTMLYQPRPGVSAQSVLTVQSWCVRGAKREVIHRATITV
ncbi:MAG: hypothetical protein IPK32_16740 [Verrucomicrobiaceae bacterium]|nr:hypothetical protein [Verrucomicrobiaceae bacterium]